METPLSHEPGVDTATALLYNCIRSAEPHRAFIEAVEAVDPDTALPSPSARLLVAPAAFWREYPQFGADGAAVMAVARGLGIDAERIPTRSTGSVSDNSRIIREGLAKEADGSVVLVSLSKGGADVRVALEQGGEARRKVRAWINVCGLVHGTPLVDEIFAAPWWRRLAVRAFLARWRAGFELLRELRHAPGSPLAARATAPEGVYVVNVVACPQSIHVTGSIAKRHRQLAALGPNDGSTLLHDAIVDGGVIYPVWGADHYFRTPDASALIRRILPTFLLFASSEDSTRRHSHPPPGGRNGVGAGGGRKPVRPAASPPSAKGRARGRGPSRGGSHKRFRSRVLGVLDV